MLLCFNPHPARRPGATTRSTLEYSFTFQSSPGQKAGCNWDLNNVSDRVPRRFNPHPARRPGATWQVPVPADCRFQSSPGQKAGCNSGCCLSPWGTWRSLFQSSPGQKAGCNVAFGVSPTARDHWSGFNPHPARRPGATLATNARDGWPHDVDVSILTRPEGRVQPAIATRERSTCFNPHPARRPGATWTAVRFGMRSDGFNPHPARRPGATYVTETLQIRTLEGFNPHPARRPGATAPPPPGHPGQIQVPVSILTRPEGRVQRRNRGCRDRSLPVSILTRPEGRVQPARPT